MDWDKLRIFYTVAQAQSFTKAGEVLNLSQSAVSRQVSALEENLRVTLFLRHARGLLLTEQGEILFRTTAEVFSKLAATESALQESKERPKGPLKITAPVALGTTWLTPHLTEFCDLYPEITLNLIVDDKELDLTMREADAAIRLFPARQPDLIQRHLISMNNSVYAANDYLRAHGVPQTVAELSKHRLIAYGEEGRLPFPEVNWLLKPTRKEEERRPHFRINSLFGMLNAVKAGIGIAALPDYMVAGYTGISRILTDLKGPATDVYFIYPQELKNSKRISVFREFIQRKMSEYKF